MIDFKSCTICFNWPSMSLANLYLLNKIRDKPNLSNDRKHSYPIPQLSEKRFE